MRVHRDGQLHELLAVAAIAVFNGVAEKLFDDQDDALPHFEIYCGTLVLDVAANGVEFGALGHEIPLKRLSHLIHRMHRGENIRYSKAQASAHIIMPVLIPYRHSTKGQQ